MHTPMHMLCPPPPLLQGSDFSSVCLDAERGTRMLLGASQDRSGGEWVTAASLEPDTLLVRRALLSWRIPALRLLLFVSAGL